MFNATLIYSRTTELETFYDLTTDLAADLATGRIDHAAFPDSRSRMDTLLGWSNEFNIKHKRTSWHETDYMQTIEDFYESKVADVKTKSPEFTPLPELRKEIVSHMVASKLFHSLTPEQNHTVTQYISKGDSTSARSYLWSSDVNMSADHAIALVDWLEQQKNAIQGPGTDAAKPQENRKQETESYRVERVRLFTDRVFGECAELLSTGDEEPERGATNVRIAFGIYQRQADGTDLHLADFGTKADAQKTCNLLNAR